MVFNFEFSKLLNHRKLNLNGKSKFTCNFTSSKFLPETIYISYYTVAVRLHLLMKCCGANCTFMQSTKKSINHINSKLHKSRDFMLQSPMLNRSPGGFLPFNQILDIFQMLLRLCWLWYRTFWALLQPSLLVLMYRLLVKASIILGLHWFLWLCRRVCNQKGQFLIQWSDCFEWNCCNSSTCCVLWLYPRDV